MQLPSVDVFIALIFLVGIGYGFLLKKEKAITTLCSVYIGLVIASGFSQTIFDFFNGNKTIGGSVWIRSNASISTISIIVFLLSIFLISGAINSSNSRSSEISPVEVFIYSSLSVALILSSILGFLPEETRNGYIGISKTAGLLFQFKTLIVVLPPLSLILLNWKKK